MNVIKCQCGIVVRVLAQFICSCGRRYDCDGKLIVYKRGKPVVRKGKRKG